MKVPPTAGDDLWKPEYKGRVGITSLASTLGLAFLLDVNGLAGGSEPDMDPGFARPKTLLPNLAAVSANFGAHGALFQQGEVDISVQNFNFAEDLKVKGVPIEFVRVSTGTPAWTTTLHVVAGALKPDLAYAYIDGQLAPEVQADMERSPWNTIPTNGTVPLGGTVAEVIARTPEDLARMVFFDWKTANQNRAVWTQPGGQDPARRPGLRPVSRLLRRRAEPRRAVRHASGRRHGHGALPRRRPSAGLGLHPGRPAPAGRAGVPRRAAHRHRRGGAHLRLDHHPRAPRARERDRDGARPVGDAVEAALQRDRRRGRAGAGADDPDGAAAHHHARPHRPQPPRRLAGARGRDLAHLLQGDAAAQPAGHPGRHRPHLHGLRDGLRDPVADRRLPHPLHADDDLPAGARPRELALRGRGLGRLMLPVLLVVALLSALSRSRALQLYA